MKNKFENNFRGNASNIQIQQGTINSSQTQNNANSFDYDGAYKLIQQIITGLPEMDLSQEDFAKASEIAQNAENDIKEKKDISLIQKGLSLLKDIFTKAVASLAATGAVHLITGFLGQGAS